MITDGSPNGKTTPETGDTFIWGRSRNLPCLYCGKDVYTPRSITYAYLDCRCPQGEVMRVRGLADERQKTQERANMRYATDLEARELVLKEKLMERRESRQEEADSTYGVEATEVEPDWEAFEGMTMDVVRAAIGKMPALLSRTDGRTILYAQKVNTVASRPNGGKSWIAIKTAMQAVERGGRVLMLDFDNKRPGVLAGRTRDMDVEATFQNKEVFQFKDTELVQHKGAMAAAVQWLLAAKDPVFSTVIIDSDTAAGVPVDGSDALPWWKSHVQPWEAAELGVLIVSHRPKDENEDDPSVGPMGPTLKRALPTGAILVMRTSKMWNDQQDGLVHLWVDKDRNGELPGVEGETIVDVVVEHVREREGDTQFLSITLEPPDSERGSADLVSELDVAMADYPDGLYSQKAVQALVKGRGKDIGMALKSLVDDGHITKHPVEGKRGFVYKSSLFQV